MGAARTEETSKSTNLQDSFAMGSDGPYYKREKTFYGFDSARNETHAVSDSEDDERNNDDAKRLRDEGKSFYIDGCYRESVLRYTEAIRLHKESHSISFGDAILAALYGNRAAALMMTGAYEAAADDCHRALQCTVAMPATGGLDSGPVFRSKISCRMARALLKAGNVWEADKAFDSAIRSAKEALVLGQLNGTAEKILNGCIMDATLGLSDVKRYRDALDGATKIKADNADKSVSVTADRRNSVQLLMFINSALTVSPGSMELHERRVNALASLKRWAELGNHCERLAAEIVKTDGIFTDDLAPLNPFPDINAATSLKPDFFDKKPDNAAGPVALRLLSAKAVCEAVMRLPNGIVPLYLRSLRLEERYTEAAKAGACIEVYVANSKNRGTRGNAPLVWLSEEKDKLRRTMSWKEQGDTLFRNGEYECAATKYAACLSIDGDGSQYNQNALENDNAGGRLHAVLHCNRAACLMALKRYREAAKECTASLRIHTHYMKAILRRGRCFVMLRQFNEAVAEYERYIRLVDEARSSPQNVSSASNAACTFDRPIDVTDAEYLKAKQELVDVRISSEPTATAARKQNRSQKKANQQQSCKDNNTRKATAKSTAKYPQEGPGRDNANAHKQHEQAGPGGANQRDRDGLGGTARKKTAAKKKEFSRGGNVPEGPSGNDGSQSQQKQQQQHQKQEKRQRQQQKQEQQRKPTPPPNLENVHCHYEVLGIAQTALISDIKKAYHKMCLKYHPDKNTEEGAADTFHRIKLAYEVLGDEKKRTYYDSRRR